MSVKKKAIKGIKWTALSSAVNAVLQLGQLMVLTRYLSAHDFGLIAILSVVVNFSQLFVDFGLSKAIIYKQKITHEQLSTLYWLNIILGVFVFLVIALTAKYIALFYTEPLLHVSIIITASALIIQSFGQQFRTLFQKELQFSILAKIDIFSATISFIFLVIFVMLGFGIYAFIFPMLLMVLTKAVLLVWYGRKEHSPELLLKVNDVKDFFSFGAYSVGDDIVNTIVSQMDIIIIGKLLGTESLGIYNIIKELILRPAQLINPIITKVSFPAMAKVNSDLLQVKQMYLKVINYVASVNFPVYVASFLLAPEIITIFLGEKWLVGIPIFQVLALWAFIRSVGNPVGSLIMAVGKPQRAMYWNIMMLVYTPLQLYVSSQWGLIGIAWGNVFSMILLFVPGWYFLIYKLCRAKLYEYIGSFFMPLVISSSVGIIVYMILKVYDGGLIYNMSISIFVGMILLYILNKKYNKDFYNIVISLLRRGK